MFVFVSVSGVCGSSVCRYPTLWTSVVLFHFSMFELGILWFQEKKKKMKFIPLSASNIERNKRVDGSI